MRCWLAVTDCSSNLGDCFANLRKSRTLIPYLAGMNEGDAPPQLLTKWSQCDKLSATS
jgi:hypothetical protein